MTENLVLCSKTLSMTLLELDCARPRRNKHAERRFLRYAVRERSDSRGVDCVPREWQSARDILPPSAFADGSSDIPQGFLPRSMVSRVANSELSGPEKGLPSRVRSKGKRRVGRGCVARRVRARRVKRALARRASKAAVKSRQVLLRGAIEGPYPFTVGQVLTSSLGVRDLDFADAREEWKERPFRAPLLRTRKTWSTTYSYWRSRYARGKWVSPPVVAPEFYSEHRPCPADAFSITTPPGMVGKGGRFRIVPALDGTTAPSASSQYSQPAQPRRLCTDCPRQSMRRSETRYGLCTDHYRQRARLGTLPPLLPDSR